MEIVEAVLAKGRFLKPSKAHGWTVVALDTARQKVAHALQYQKRRHTKNALKQPQKVTLTFLPMSTIVNNDDQEGTMASYPNVNRTYFSEQPAGFNVSTNETFLSATEKYLHGMVAAEPAVTSIQAIFRHNQDSASFKSTPQHLPLGSIMPRHYIEPETPLLTTLLSLCAEQSVVGSVNKSVSPTAPILARVDDIQVWDDEWDLSDGDFLAGVGFVSSGTDGFKPISLANIDFEPFDIDTEPIKFDSSETNAIQRPVQVPQGKRNYCTKDISALAASKKLLSDTKSTVDDTTSFRFFPIDCELAKSSAVCDDLPSLDLFDILEMEHQREMTLVDQSREWEKCTENDESLSSSFYIDATEPLAFEGALSAW